MIQAVLNQYVNQNFPYRPTETLTWKYQLRDTIDEWLWLFGGIGGFTLIKLFAPEWGKYVAIFGWTLCACFALYLIGVLILRRLFTKYELTPDHFQYTHGLFVQKIETFQLSDIVQINLRRSIWERIIRTGTVKIRFKTATEIKINPLVIHGIGRYEEMFEKIDYYRNHHRLVLYFGI